MRLVFKKKILLIFSVFWMIHGFAQSDKVNQFDENDRRHGKWEKLYSDNEQPGFKGQFEHGKEVGTFEFFYNYEGNPNRRPVFTKTHDPNSDTIALKFYNQQGDFLKSEGQMIGRDRVGEWRYYKKGYKDNLIMVEHYQKNNLHGRKIVYFPNGQITEMEHYDNGLKTGNKKVYDIDGQLLQDYQFVRDTLHGSSTIYNASGQKVSAGNYKKGLKHGKWEFYTDGELDSIQTYPIKRPKRKEKRN